MFLRYLPPLVFLLSPAQAQSPASVPQAQLPVLKTTVTVTAERGASSEAETSAVLIQAAESAQFSSFYQPTTGNVLEGMSGLLVQQSTYGQASPFLRGLTGYHVLNLIDGVRFNNSTFRSGPNQYLAFVDPSQAFRIETALGPTGAQYGSDAMGGAIQVLTPPLRCSDSGRRQTHGELRLAAASADRSTGGSALVSVGGERWSWLVGASGRGLNDLRAGGGRDSRHSLRRLFGLSPEQIAEITGRRQLGTGFMQSGFYSKAGARLAREQSLSFWYQQSALSSVQGYKDLWGGLGRMESVFDPQTLHFAYARYERNAWGWLDSLSATFSLNRQGDGSRRQALRQTDPLTIDAVAVRALGYSGQAVGRWGKSQTLAFGADLYDEHIGAWRRTRVAGLEKAERPLYPNSSAYHILGLFIQDRIALFGGRLRALLVGRWTRAGFRTRADAFGATPTRQFFNDVTYQSSLSVRLARWSELHLLAGRGFRAPNLNDLGAVGLNDLGFEIPAAESVGAGALIGSSAGENALSSGRKVSPLRPESLSNWEAGWTLRHRAAYVRWQVFYANLFDPITRRTLLFPADQAPAALAGLPVTPLAPTPEQRAQGVVPVATALDPRAVKAFVNDGQSRYFGVEWLARYAFHTHWRAEATYSFLAGSDLHPNRPIRRLPPQAGSASLRWEGRWWIQARLVAAGPQLRLSGGDIDDERIGASRRRRDIADFFHGSRIAPWIRDGRFTLTQETLAEVQNRVLPLGAVIEGVRVIDDNTRVPLFRSTGGWLRMDVWAAAPLGERWRIGGGISNLLDRNYRVHGSGLDAPGINVFANLCYRF